MAGYPLLSTLGSLKGGRVETIKNLGTVQLSPEYVLWLSILATAGLVLMWAGSGWRLLALREVFWTICKCRFL